MKVSVICQARFHAFNMAEYFQRQGILNELVTGYPKWIVTKYKVKKSKIKSIYINEIIIRLWYKVFKSNRLNFFADNLFDRIAAFTIKKDSDIFCIWSGCALHTINAIRRVNSKAIIILVRCSGHIEVQNELLSIVNRSQSSGIDPRMIEKEKKEYEAADYITLPSTFALNSFLEKHVPERKLFLNLYGVDLEEFPYYEHRNTQADKLVIGYVGALSKRKNIEAVIHVVDKLIHEGLKLELLIAGKVDHESFDEIMLTQYSFINYKGKLPQNELHLLYKQMDVFVLNSIEEGLAYVQMQAMSCGLPLISTTNAGGLDLVEEGKNGFIIPILDDNALAEKITWFYYNKSKIPKMGKVSRAMSERGLTWEDFGRRNISFFKQVLFKRHQALLNK